LNDINLSLIVISFYIINLTLRHQLLVN